jgi:hypothetical protein
MVSTQTDNDPAARVDVPAGYRCPLCRCCCRSDARYLASQVVGKPICEGCAIELSIFLEEDDREDDPVLDALERETGLSFLECRRRHYREVIDTYEWFLDPAHRDRSATEEIMITRRSAEETVAHWRQVVEDYGKVLMDLQGPSGG